jgi:hypothetical protein
LFELFGDFTALWPVGGYIIGRQHWHGAEREYTAWVARASEQRHAEPSVAPDRRPLAVPAKRERTQLGGGR